MNRLFFFLKIFGFFLIGLGVSAFTLFYGNLLLIGDNHYRSVFEVGFFWRSYHFHLVDEQPFLYLLSIVLVSSIVGSVWVTFLAPRLNKWVKVQILVIPWISVFLISPIWGLLYSYHLRAPGFFVDNFPNNPESVMWYYYKTDAVSGLNASWMVALQSFPINILSYMVFCLILHSSIKLFLEKARRIGEK